MAVQVDINGLQAQVSDISVANATLDNSLNSTWHTYSYQEPMQQEQYANWSRAPGLDSILTSTVDAGTPSLALSTDNRTLQGWVPICHMPCHPVVPPSLPSCWEFCMHAAFSPHRGYACLQAQPPSNLAAWHQTGTLNSSRQAAHAELVLMHQEALFSYAVHCVAAVCPWQVEVTSSCACNRWTVMPASSQPRLAQGNVLVDWNYNVSVPGGGIDAIAVSTRKATLANVPYTANLTVQLSTGASFTVPVQGLFGGINYTPIVRCLHLAGGACAAMPIM